MNYILSYKEFILEKVVYSPEQQKIRDILRITGGVLVMLGGLGGILSTLQGYLITKWEEEAWKIKNDPNFKKKEPKTAIGKFFKKHHLKLLVVILLAAGGFTAWGVYKMFNAPMGIPDDVDDYTGESIKNDDEFGILLESATNQNKITNEIEDLLKRIDGKSIIRKVERGNHVTTELQAIANASSKNAALPIAIKLQDYIKTQLSTKEIEVLDRIGNSVN